jgi:hypothetical protein
MFLNKSATVKCSAWQIRLKIIEADRHPGTTTKGSDPAQRRVEPDLPERGQQIGRPPDVTLGPRPRADCIAVSHA